HKTRLSPTTQRRFMVGKDTLPMPRAIIPQLSTFSLSSRPSVQQLGGLTGLGRFSASITATNMRHLRWIAIGLTDSPTVTRRTHYDARDPTSAM
ncbi:MAG: hypothetical protein AAF220_07155, partial [Pseudomonadota bacterium]